MLQENLILILQLTKQGPPVNLSGHGDLETATIAGDIEFINLDGNGNLTTVTITADVDGSQGIVLNGNSDLSYNQFTGAKQKYLLSLETAISKFLL